jgi:hypothetical protein
VREKIRGRGTNKRRYGIEMNEPREVYLGSYSSMDSVDHLLKNWNCAYQSWKWWHAPMQHGLAFAATMAYFMYVECSEGDLDPSWRIDNPMTMKQFRRRFSQQMCNYRSYKEHYPGDEFLRTTTKVERNRRGKRKATDQLHRGRVTYGDYMEMNQEDETGVPLRFCNDNIHSLKSLFHSMQIRKSGIKCVVCGKDGAYWQCGICKKAMHWSDPITVSDKKDGKGKHQQLITCALDYHNEYFLDLPKMMLH